MKTFANKVITFNNNLQFTGKLPTGFRVLNPYLDNAETMQVMQQFYQKYYNDNSKRKFIVGINPSRQRYRRAFYRYKKAGSSLWH